MLERNSECRLNDRTVSPRSHMEQEKRIRREIANSNERRRMQSINAGFQSLRTLLPSHEGEKLSKVKSIRLRRKNECTYVEDGA
ncbi:protein lin-32, putative [Pediculus humanus corporis]|uniref:Protein lin-32, putative n=1 Tax=Pediculus humanus subsp. corporis TaxID=121224 RepID=E0W3A6_PEDHC|nr:protein lin-32, putative [Pediculus humanus corporis]EEB20112.1 protein lin-32, putative [Pediculus humanus corporis]